MDEGQGAQTAGEAGGSRRRLAGALLAPALLLGILLSPLPLEPRAHTLLGLFAAVVVLWVSEALPIAVTALLIAPALVLAGVCDAKTAFAPYADPLLFLFVGGFMIARAMTRHGLDRRLALGLVSLPVIRSSPGYVRLAFMGAALLLSMWISNTATAAILAPILIGLAGPGKDARADAPLTGSLLCVAYACSIGGLGTPVGSPPNLIALGFLRDAGHALTFFDWMKVGLPAALLMLAATYLLFQRRFPPTSFAGAVGLSPPPGRPSRGEVVTIVAFLLAVVGWMLPGVLSGIASAGGDDPSWIAVLAGELAPAVEEALPGGAVALLAAGLLFAVPDGEGERVLPWEDAVGIDWGIILLFGGGISLGKQIFDTGLAAWLSRGFVELTGVEELWTLTALVTVFTIFFTETCSNTATSNMLAPLVVAICVELEISPVPPVLAVGLAASCAFMLPIATGPNAVVYGTGRVDQPTMIRMGFLLNLVCAAIIWVVLRVLCPAYGWG